MNSRRRLAPKVSIIFSASEPVLTCDRSWRYSQREMGIDAVGKPASGAPVDEALDAVGVRLVDGRIGVAARSEDTALRRVDNPGNCRRAGEAGVVAPKVGPAIEKEVVLEIVRGRLRRGNLRLSQCRIGRGLWNRTLEQGIPRRRDRGRGSGSGGAGGLGSSRRRLLTTNHAASQTLSRPRRPEPRRTPLQYFDRV